MKFNLQSTFFSILRILLVIVLIGKISNWVFDYNDKVSGLLNIVMFCLLGIAYIGFGFVMNRMSAKAIFLICGLYLIGMNFIDRNTFLTLIEIICILTPLLLTRFFPKMTVGDEMEEESDASAT
jgi:hypothetical protein